MTHATIWSRTRFSSFTRGSYVNNSPCSSIISGPVYTRLVPSTRDVAAQSSAHSSATLQTVTVDEEYAIETAYFQAQVEQLTVVRDRIVGLDHESQVTMLRGVGAVRQTLQEHRELDKFISAKCPPHLQAALLATIAAGQAHVVTLRPQDRDVEAELLRLAEDLAKVQSFYDALGGIIGYQLKCLQLICDAKAQEYQSSIDLVPDASPDEEDSTVEYLEPVGPNFQGGDRRSEAQQAAGDGLLALPSLAEVYPLGGAGDRLGLVCEDTGEPLPSAMLPYCGRPMIAGLFRDLTAREYLYFRLFGEQHTTPVAIMTSDAKGNHRRVVEILSARRHFGRPAASLCLFCQPLVPVLEAATGMWVLPEALRPSMKPGGHGAIWKLMHDNGVFDWLAEQGRTAALVRQISNPMAATDCTMLALAGVGARGGRAFGFASCNRTVGASEGMNVLMHRRHSSAAAADQPAHEYGVTNVEYTEFQRLGISDVPTEAGGSESCFPANTNILYVGLEAAAAAVRGGIASGEGGASLPGMIFNLSKQITYTPALRPGAPPAEPRVVHAGRMECTMQNLADSLTQRFPEPAPVAELAQLGTFVVFNERRYVTSSAKRALQPGSTKVAQTPEGSFLDLMRNAWDMLALCGVRAPRPCSTREYLDRGCAPSFVWLWNPALGPLWAVVAQKVSGGEVAEGAEVDLELAELCWRDVTVDGSLLVHADHVVGAPDGSGAVRFSETSVGRARLERVHIRNSGLAPVAAGAPASGCAPCHWKRSVPRLEACRISLRGRSEFDARDVVIGGDAEFEVPDGHRMEVFSDASADCGYGVRMTPLSAAPSWRWDCRMTVDKQVQLALVEAPSCGSAPPASTAATMSE